MKKAILIAACAIFLASALLWGAWRWLNGPFLAKLLAGKSQALTGSPILLKGDPKLDFFPASITLSGVSWRSPGSDPACEFSANRLRADFEPLSLFDDQIHITRLAAISPRLKLNLAAGRQLPHFGEEKPAGKGQGGSAEKMPILLDRLLIQNGEVSFEDDDLALRLGQLNLAADGFGPRRETDLKCDFSISAGKPGEAADLAGNLALRAKPRLYQGNLTFRQASLSFTATEGKALMALSPIALELEGSFNLEEQALRLTGARASAGSARLLLAGDYLARERSFDGHASLTLGAPEEAEADAPEAPGSGYGVAFAGPARLRGESLSFPDLAISSGGSKGSGKLDCRLPGNGRPARIAGELAFGRLILPIVEGKGKGRAAPDGGGARAKGKAPWPELDLAFSASALEIGGFKSRDASFQLSGSEGRYALDGLRFIWAGGQAGGSGKVDLNDKLVMLKTKGEKLNLGEALLELGVKGFEGGLASYDAALAATGFDLRSIKSSLAGDFSFEARDVKIRVLEDMSRFLSRFSPGQRLVPKGLNLFSVSARGANGLLEIGPVFIKSDAYSAQASGKLSLPKDSVDAQVDLKAFGMSLPVQISGALSDLSWRIEPEWLKKLW